MWCGVRVQVHSPGDLPDPGIKPMSPALAGRFFTIEPDIPISLLLPATCFSCLRHDVVDGA